MTQPQKSDLAESVLKRFQKARDKRVHWEAHWQECYDYALPSLGGPLLTSTPGAKRTDRLFDATAADCVDQLAASLLAQLTPPWAQWFGLSAGPDLSPDERERAADVLEKAGTALQSHFDRSNFAIEMHQCYLDLVTAGTASLLFEEAPLGHASAFRFTAVPLAQLALDESVEGRLDTSFRRSEMTLAAIQERFANAEIPDQVIRRSKEDEDARHGVIEAVLPERHGYVYRAVLEGEGSVGAHLLSEGRFEMSPFINFRWLKAPGEVYGRSPVMKSLPDIKTANKVVELVLKNATIAVTGIWQADDDGVLNPANIKLVPGTIIPKAVGSAGLTPLESPGRFDVSQLMLDDLRKRITHSLLADRLGPIDAPKLTATEVLERSAEMARILGATYGRLQSELLTPLVLRAVAILKRRGEIPPLRIDGRQIDLAYKSPLANERKREDARNALQWLTTVMPLGPEASQAINLGAAARWLAGILNVPAELVRDAPALPESDPALAALGMGAVPGLVAPPSGQGQPVPKGVS
jgi:hypothetical protein